MIRPWLITFTGVDEHTDVARLYALSQRYPVEWGVLFSPSRQGTGRYPSIDWVRQELLAEAPAWLVLSAHLCGGHAQSLLERGVVNGGGLTSLISIHFDRLQVNATAYPDRLVPLQVFCADAMVRPILQHRGEFPPEKPEWLDLLFDCSGGRGKAPAAWPAHPGNADVGYAGGIGPDNAAAVVRAINAAGLPGRYWIDMETGVRDSNDRLDLTACEAVCRAIYGDRA